MKKKIQLITAILLFAGLTTGLLANERSIVKIGGDVHVEKDERVEDAVAVGGSVYIDGIVDGDAVAIGGTVHLGEEAVVYGDAVTVGGKLDQTEGAKIYGTTVDVGSFDFDNIFKDMDFFDGHRGIPRGLKFIPFIGLLALVLLFSALLPKELGKVAEYVRNEPVIMFLWGFLGVILIIPLALMLAISIIGIPLIPIEMLAIFLATVIGFVAVAMMIGKKILRALNSESPSVILSAILGVIVIWLIGLIPILGPIVKTIVAITGFGAVIIAVARRNKKNNDDIVIESETVEVIEGKEA